MANGGGTNWRTLYLALAALAAVASACAVPATEAGGGDGPASTAGGCTPGSDPAPGGDGAAAPTPQGAGGATPAAPGEGSGLPGRLVVNNADLVDLNWVTYTFDLATGAPTRLPSSDRGYSNGEDAWAPSADGSRLLRYESNGGELVIFDAATLAPLTSWTRRNLSEPLLSPDGRYVLAQWYDEDGGEYSGDRAITVFDAATGSVVEHGSEQPYGYGGSRTYGWLPDGRYIYLLGAEIWVTAPDTPDATVLVDLSAGLPDPVVTTIANGSFSVSPDGIRIALAWFESRDSTNDYNLWVASLDGSDLHRLTVVPDPSDPLSFSHGSPTWSPDGRYVAGVRYMSGTVTAPVNPNDDTGASGAKVVGGTGCIDQIFVVPADARNVALSWPELDQEHGVVVQSIKDGTPALLTICGGTISWMP